VTHPPDGNGHRRQDQFTYYASGSQRGYLYQRILDADNLALTSLYEWDLVGNIARITDPRGNDTRFVVNQLNQVVRVQGPELAPGIVSYEWDFFYDENDSLVRWDQQNRDEAGVLRANTHLTRIWDYDSLNSCVRSTREKGDANLASSVLSYDDIPAAERNQFATTGFVYDANHNLARIRLPEAMNGNQPGNVVQTFYDERDLPFQTSRAPGGPDQATTQYDYDGNGNTVRRLEGLEDGAQVAQFLYDGYGRVVRSTDPMGNMEESVYDANGNPTQFLLMGELVDVPDSADNVRLAEAFYQYDALDRLVRCDVAHFDPAAQAPVGDGYSTTLWAYAPNGRIFSATRDNGSTTAYAYDTASRLAQSTDGKGNRVAFTYDGAGNLVTVVETDKSDLGNADQVFTTQFAYDALDRLVQTTDNVGNSNRFTYDSRHNLVLRVDSRGHEVRCLYDGLNRPLKYAWDLDNDGANLAAEPGDGNPDIIITQSWDDDSRLTSQTDDNGNTTTYLYDSLNRLTGTTFADGTSSTSVFDAHGNVVAARDQNGTEMMMTYDALDRLQNRTVVVLGANVYSNTTFEVFAYDGRGMLVRAEDDNSLVERRFDSMRNLTQEQLNGTPTSFVYDGTRNQLQIAYPSGRLISMSYDARGRMQTINDGTTTIAAFKYIGPNDRIERVDFGNGTREDLTYDGVTGAANQPGDFGVRQVSRTRHTVVGSGNVIFDQIYRWDRVGNKVDRMDPALFHHMYAYDSVNRIVRTMVTDTSMQTVRDEQYVLDGVHNRTGVTGGNTPGTYIMNSALPEPGDAQMNQYSATSFDTRTYDKNGNLVGRTFMLPDMEDLRYDFRNRLVQRLGVTSGQRAVYVYDALGRRIARVTDADGVAGGPVETRYYYNGWKVIEEQNNLAATQATYVWEEFFDFAVEMKRGGNSYYYHSDDLYNVMALTDSSGAVVERYQYGDYGQPLNPITLAPIAGNPSAVGNPHLFNGHRYDPESGFYDYRMRYLDPVAGRFISRDPIGIWGDTGSLGNGTAYVGNNPWTSLDPLGLDHHPRHRLEELRRQAEREASHALPARSRPSDASRGVRP